MPTELSLQSSQPWKPHAYQRKAIRFAVARGAAGLFLEPGLGKTGVAYALVKLLRRVGVEKTLVVAPLRVCHLVWPRERDKWTDFEDLRVVVLHGKDKEAMLLEDADVFVINPEGLPWLLGVEKTKSATGRTKVTVDVKRWKKHGFDMLVVDELSKFKDPSTQRFKALKQVLPTFKRRYGMTGSPNANHMLDLFGQAYLLDEGRSLGRYITHYRSLYFDESWNGYEYTLKAGAEKKIWKRLKPLAVAMKATDYLDLPKFVEDVREVELPAAARLIYDAVERDLVARIDDKVVVASNAAAASTKCRQVANGVVYVDDELKALVKLPKSAREVAYVHEAKAEALAELVDELQGKQLLVAYHFEHDLDLIRGKLGKVPHIGGGVSTKATAKLEAAWNAGDLPILLAHPQSVGHGLNLQGSDASHVAWFAMTWNFELYDQFVRRVLRQGNKSRRVVSHLLVARDTVDEDVLAALRSKRRGAVALFDALKTRVRARSSTSKRVHKYL